MRIHLTPVWRLVVGVVVGTASGFLIGHWLGWAAGLLGGWGAGAFVAVAWILLAVWRMDAAQTRTHATREDPGRRIARVISVLGSVASLGAVAFVLLESRDAGRLQSFVLAAIAVFSVVSSWALIQVDYMLRVAHLYYTPPAGGISFNQDEDPMYTDFAYFSVGLGMTYQVADTNVQTSQLRRVVIAQTMLAYLFGAVILATVINLVSNLA